MSKTIYTEIAIPAYSAMDDAFLLTLKLTATPNPKLSIKTSGNIAIALKRALQRVIEIMSSLNHDWLPLLSFQYFLEGDAKQFLVKDARSASVSLAIGLLNIYRSINHKSQIKTLVGTGILRIDGSIESTHKEEIKQTTMATIPSKQLITSSICQHVFELEHFMDNN
ncbi:MAG: hypothetical protein K0U37_06645 [Gammaproteobacteria bacterium]|nr:hypothetical protein [Gammaproteobacteria bacterium]